MEDLQNEIPFGLHRVEIVRTRMQAGHTQQHADQKCSKSNTKKCQDRKRKIFKLWTIQTKGADGECFDDDHVMGPKVTQHTRQKKTVMIKTNARHQNSHGRAKRADKEAEGEKRSFFCQNSHRDQQHINVAKMERQFAPPVEAASVRGEYIVVCIQGKEQLIEKETDQREHTADDNNGLLDFIALVSDQKTDDCQEHNEESCYAKEKRIERAEVPERILSQVSDPP